MGQWTTCDIICFKQGGRVRRLSCPGACYYNVAFALNLCEDICFMALFSYLHVFFLLGHFFLLTRAFYPFRKSKLAQLEGIFYMDLVPEGWAREGLLHKSAFLPCLCLFLWVLCFSQTLSRCLWERDYIYCCYLICVLGQLPNARWACKQRVQKMMEAVFNSSLPDQCHSGF